MQDDDEEKEENYDGENGDKSDEENDDEKQEAALTYSGTADDVAVCAVPLATYDGCRACVAIHYGGGIRNARMLEAVGCCCRYRRARARRSNRRFALDPLQRDLPVPR